MSENQDPFNISDALAVFQKHRLFVISSTLVTALLFTLVSFKIPKKYKVHFDLTIYSKYFQNPLIRDFIPEIDDSAEMRSQRESLIRQSLTPDFVDSLGERYGLYKSTQVPAVRTQWQEWILRIKSGAEKLGLLSPHTDTVLGSPHAIDREELLTHIQILGITGDTFRVAFVGSDPQIVYQVTQDLYTQITKTLLQVRYDNLVNIRDAIRKRMESIGYNMVSAPDPGPTDRMQPIRDQLGDVRNQIRNLITQYTEEHPRVQELRDRERMLTKLLEDAGVASNDPGRHTRGVPGQSTDAAKDIYSDLMKKMNYLNIAIDSDQQRQSDYFATLESPIYPTSPLFPKKALFALWGCAVGFLGSLFISAIREYFVLTTLHTSGLAEKLHLPVIGELPQVRWKSRLQSAPPQKPARPG